MVAISILCLTYNHQSYITKCLNSFLSQRTRLNYEILIHDDGSTDGTVETLKEYQNLHQDKIQLILNKNEANTEIKSFHHILGKFKPKGKYIAFCEGDDYWTDENKLQIQYDFLESHLNYSFCCHRYKRLIKGELKDEIAHNFYSNQDLEISKGLFFNTWITQPLTSMLRAEYWNEVLVESKNFKYFRDVHLFYAYLQKGKGISLNRFMGVYRIHDKGHTSGKSTLENLLIAYEIWKELLTAYPEDNQLHRQLLAVVRRIMLYSSLRNKFNLYIKNLKLSSRNLKDFLRLHLSLVKKANPPIS